MRELRSTAELETILSRDAEAVRAWIRRARTQEQHVPAQFNWLGLAEATAFNARRSADLVPATLDTYPAARRAALQGALLAEHPSLRDDGEDSAWLARALDARRWAEAAIAVYDHLTGKTASRERQGYQGSVMHLRAYLIVRIGIIRGDRILGSDDLLFYFFDGLGMDIKQARFKAQTIRDRLLAHKREEEAHIDHDWQDRRETVHGGTKPLLVKDIRALRAIKNRLAPLELLVASGQLKPPPSLQPWLELREQLP